MADDVRARALFSGRVQGVGFRFTARRTASGYAVRGYVRNLVDGRVEVVAEGAKDEILAFLKAVRGAMEHYVDRMELSWTPATAEFSGFSVKF